MLSLKSEVGKVAGPYMELVSPERIAQFCEAIGANTSRLGTEGAPPTFLTVFRKAEFELFNRLGFDLSQVLHTEQEYQYTAPLMGRDQVEFTTVLTHVLEKLSVNHSMQFLTFETEFHALRDLEKIKIGLAKTTILIRSGK